MSFERVVTWTSPLASVTRRLSESRVMSPGKLAICTSVKGVCSADLPAGSFNVRLAEELSVQRNLALNL